MKRDLYEITIYPNSDPRIRYETFLDVKAGAPFQEVLDELNKEYEQRSIYKTLQDRGVANKELSCVICKHIWGGIFWKKVDEFSFTLPVPSGF